MVSVGHVAPEEPGVYQSHQNNMALGSKSLLKKPQSRDGIIVEQLGGCHVLWPLSAGADVIALDTSGGIMFASQYLYLPIRE